MSKKINRSDINLFCIWEKYERLFGIIIVIFTVLFAGWNVLYWPKEVKSEISSAKEERQLAKLEREKLEFAIKEQENCCHTLQNSLSTRVTQQNVESTIDKAIAPLQTQLNNLQNMTQELYIHFLNKQPTIIVNPTIEGCNK